ncbi:MAG: hypothetical protein ABI609_15425 [Acidobacteriota bacterium]
MIAALLRLQLGGRWVLFLVADAVLLVSGWFDALVSSRDSASAGYVFVAIAPALLLGIPALSDLVALERDAGSLDLLLSVPGATRHLQLRAFLVGAVMLLQSWVAIATIWLGTDVAFALLPALAHSAAVVALVVCASLFWAARLETAGAVGIATLVTAVGLGPWFLEAPTIPRTAAGGNSWLPGAETGLGLLANVVVLAAASTVLLLAARRRLARAELLLR